MEVLDVGLLAGFDISYLREMQNQDLSLHVCRNYQDSYAG